MKARPQNPAALAASQHKLYSLGQWNRTTANFLSFSFSPFRNSRGKRFQEGIVKKLVLHTALYILALTCFTASDHLIQPY